MTDFSRPPAIRSLEDLRDLLREFNAARRWHPYHSPKNLAMSILIEAAELAEHFQWQTTEESRSCDPEKRAAVEEEVADVLIYLVTLADKLDIDPLAAARRKLVKNNRRYPAPGPDHGT